MYETFSSDDEEEWGDEFKQSTHGGAADKQLKWSLTVHVLPGIGDRVYLPPKCLEELSLRQAYPPGGWLGLMYGRAGAGARGANDI